MGNKAVLLTNIAQLLPAIAAPRLQENRTAAGFSTLYRKGFLHRTISLLASFFGASSDDHVPVQIVVVGGRGWPRTWIKRPPGMRAIRHGGVGAGARAADPGSPAGSGRCSWSPLSRSSPTGSNITRMPSSSNVMWDLQKPLLINRGPKLKNNKNKKVKFLSVLIESFYYILWPKFSDARNADLIVIIRCCSVRHSVATKHILCSFSTRGVLLGEVDASRSWWNTLVWLSRGLLLARVLPSPSSSPSPSIVKAPGGTHRSEKHMSLPLGLICFQTGHCWGWMRHKTL